MREKKVNAGYEIISSMNLYNQFGTEVGIALGYNEKAPSPYVTWECNQEQNTFILGHYFVTKDAAMRDFFERGMKVTSLDLKQTYQEEKMLTDIKEALAWGYDKDTLNDLVKSEGFLQQAYFAYEDLEHSFKRESLFHALEKIHEGTIEKQEIADKKFDSLDLQLSKAKTELATTENKVLAHKDMSYER